MTDAEKDERIERASRALRSLAAAWPSSRECLTLDQQTESLRHSLLMIVRALPPAEPTKEQKA